MRKRRILLFAFVCMLMGCVLVLLACSDDNTHTHTYSDDWTADATHHWHAATCEHTDESSDRSEHDWDEGAVTTEPTESEDGVKTFTCKVCNEVKTEAVPALGHQHTFASTLSYDEGGHYYAATCGHTNEKKDYTAHDFDEDVTAPTCLVGGYTTYACGCGYTYQGNLTSATDHDWIIASSNDNGTHNLICANSSAHTDVAECEYAQNVVVPACTTGGYTSYTCECGHAYVDNEEDPDGHDFSDTWTKNDAYHWHAATCEHVDQMKDYAAHEYTIFVSVTDPTCTADGYTTYACVCGAQQNRDIVASDGHDYGEFVEQGRTLFDESCCKYAVTYTTSCSVCGDPQQKVEYTENHSFYQEKEAGENCTVTGELAAKKPTCKSEGIQHKHCANPECRYYHESAENTYYADADAHVWNDGVKNGSVITYTCTLCTKTKNTAVVEGDTADISSGEVDEVEIGETTINMNQTMKETLTQGDGEVKITAGVTEDEEAKKALLQGYGFTLEDIGSKPIYSFTVTGADEENFGQGGKATITIPYTLETGDDRNNVIVFYISNGELIAIEADYWENAEGKGFATFKTEHFSDYVPTSVRPEELCALFGEHSTDLHVVAPSCTTGGHTVCLRCNEIIATTAPLGHKWVSTVVAVSTCSDNGTMHHTCANCDTAYDTVIAATGHYYVLESNTVASCKSEGSSVFGCIYCDGAYTVTTPQLAHQYVTKTAAASCTERGYTQRSCTLCGDVQTSYTAPLGHEFNTAWEKGEEGHYHTCLTCGVRDELIAHVPGAEATEEHAQLCTACEYVLVPQLTHQHKNMSYFESCAASCTESGNKAYYVCACGKWFLDADGTQLITDHTSVILDATGHTNETIPYLAPGCETPGHTAGVKCSVCDNLLRGNIEIAPTGHDYKQTITKPTCTTGGYTLFTCACGDSYQGDETEALGHRYQVSVTVPTCEEGGYTTYTCSYCTATTEGHQYVSDEVAALGHAFFAAWTTDAQNHWHVCARCDKKDGFGAHEKNYPNATEEHGVNCTACGYEIEAIKNHAHAPARSVAAKAADCITSGRIAYYVCSCGEWFADAACTVVISDHTAVIIPAPGHTLEYHRGVAATCYSVGYTEGYSCTRCDYEGGRVELPVVSHNFNTPILYNQEGHWHKCLACNATDGIVAHEYDARVTAPTCTAPGYTEFRCACGYDYVGAEVAATGHSFGDWVANYDGTHTRVCSADPRHRETADCEYTDTVIAPNCSTKGYTLHACVCGYSYKDAYVDAKGHAFGEWISNKDGTHTRVCANDAAHTETADCVYKSVVTDPTCEEKGFTTYTCDCTHSYVDDFVDAKGHAFGDWTSNKDGTHTRVCANDAAHTETADCVYKSVVTAPTCEEKGFTTYTCDCTHSYVDDFVDAKGHAFGDWTSNNDGTHTRVCANDATHTETEKCVYKSVVTDPTCEEKGFTTYTCDCTHSYVDDFVDAKGHAFGDWTSNNDGTHTRVCANDAAHTETAACVYKSVVTDPTCEEKGFTTYTCDCTHSYKDDFVDAKGHDYQNGKCVNCGDPEAGGEIPTVSVNTILAQIRTDAETGRRYLALVLQNADLAGVHLDLVLDQPIQSDVECHRNAQYHVNNQRVSVVYSGGENTVTQELEILRVYLKDGYTEPDPAKCSLEINDIYRFAENGELVVPTYAVRCAQ